MLKTHPLCNEALLLYGAELPALHHLGFGRRRRAGSPSGEKGYDVLGVPNHPKHHGTPYLPTVGISSMTWSVWACIWLNESASSNWAVSNQNMVTELTEAHEKPSTHPLVVIICDYYRVDDLCPQEVALKRVLSEWTTGPPPDSTHSDRREGREETASLSGSAPVWRRGPRAPCELEGSRILRLEKINAPRPLRGA